MLASIPSPSINHFSLGPLSIHIYGLCYIAAVLVAVLVTQKRWEDRGGSGHLVQEVALWAFPAGLVGGRIYHVITSFDQLPKTWWGPFAIWQGGLGIWGGIALGTLVGIWVLRRHRANVALFLDAAAPGLLLAQAIGRIGNYFNQELFGLPTKLPWGLEIDPVHRPPGYESVTTFHPVFFYELIWNVCLAGALVLLGRKFSIRPPGIFALYVCGYSFARIFEELLRIDPANHVLGLRLNFYVAVILFLAGAAWFIYTQRRPTQTRARTETLRRVRT
jgi:prolipoprotein diacylglyceryl transferase